MKFKIIPNTQTPKIEHKITNVQAFIKDNRKLLEKFLSFARRQHNCVGLAANQVSVDGERIMLPFFAILNEQERFWDIFIAPELVEEIGEPVETKERCLTWLGKTIEATRYPIVHVKYTKLNGESKEDLLHGFHGQIFQHEYNHLMGIEEKVKVREKNE